MDKPSDGDYLHGMGSTEPLMGKPLEPVEDNDVVEHIDQAEKLFIEAFGDDVWQEILRQRVALDRPLKTSEVEAIIQLPLGEPRPTMGRLPTNADRLVTMEEIRFTRRALLLAIGTSKQMSLEHRALANNYPVNAGPAAHLLAASFDRDAREFQQVYDDWLARFGE